MTLKFLRITPKMCRKVSFAKKISDHFILNQGVSITDVFIRVITCERRRVYINYILSDPDKFYQFRRIMIQFKIIKVKSA